MVDRVVAHVVRPTRLPIWPVANGVLSIAASAVGLRWFDGGGGRVTPISLPAAADPFLMPVHHRHSFSSWDPIRPLSALVMPEGFPAHPHRGFETVTFVLEGAMRHRDSSGLKMVYRGESAQWLTAGKGVLHEEMWAQGPSGKTFHELYQIWINLPRAHKWDEPEIQVVGEAEIGVGGESVSHWPLPVAEADGVRVTVLSGSSSGVTSPIRTRWPVAIVRVQWQAAGAFAWDVPAGYTALMFVRSGAGQAGGRDVGAGDLAFFERNGELRLVGQRGSDVLLLTGKPLGEPVAMGGSMVMSTEAEVQQAHRDVERGVFGRTWSPWASDEEWLATIRR